MANLRERAAPVAYGVGLLVPAALSLWAVWMLGDYLTDIEVPGSMNADIRRPENWDESVAFGARMIVPFLVTIAMINPSLKFSSWVKGR